MVSPVPPDNNGFYPFRLTITEAKQLLRSADGLQSYPESTGWDGFPQRSQDEYGVGFTDAYEFTHGVLGSQDGSLSFEESNLAMQQLAWDRESMHNGYETTNPNPISAPNSSWALSDMNPFNAQGGVVDQAGNATNFFSQIFFGLETVDTTNPFEPTVVPAGSLRPEMDPDGNGEFTEADIELLAPLDGDAEHLSDADLGIAFDNYREGVVEEQAALVEDKREAGNTDVTEPPTADQPEATSALPNSAESASGDSQVETPSETGAKQKTNATEVKASSSTQAADEPEHPPEPPTESGGGNGTRHIPID